jgi:hypothetical protein
MKYGQIAGLTATALVLAACDGIVTPGRSRMTLSRSSAGDFPLPMLDVSVPDTVAPGDTMRVVFTVGPNHDPCSYNTTEWFMFAGVTYLSSWGIRHPGSTCRATMMQFPLPGRRVAHPDSLVLGKDGRVIPLWTWRLVLCQPDGPPIVKEFKMLAPLESTFDITETKADSIAAADARQCRFMSRFG